MQPSIENLMEAARRLRPEDRHRLAHALLDEIPQTALAQHRITEIRGLGKDVWKDVDAQDYVNSERDAWEN